MYPIINKILQASYVKASDVFGGACMTFVFAALIEFTIVNYCTRRKIHERSENRYSLAAQAKRMAEKQVCPYFNSFHAPILDGHQ
jgi:hypothetical protein